MNIVDRIFEHAVATPDRPAFFSEGHGWTYADLARAVDPLADRLQATLEIGPPLGSTRVGLACPDGMGYVLLALGLLRAGACVVPIAGELAEPERDRLTRTLRLHGLVVGPGFEWENPPGEVRLGGVSEPARATEAAPLDAASGSGLARSRVSVLEPGEGASADFDEQELAALQPAFIRFSSGTTGQSKGVVISHQSLAQRIDAASEALGIGPGDRIIWILPMAHHFAVTLMCYLLSGAATVIVGSHLASDVLTAGRQHHGTVLYASPFHHAMLAGESSGEPWPDLRLAVSTAFALNESTAAAFEKRFNRPLSQALGVIEAGLPCVNLPHGSDKPTSIGRPMPRFEVQLRDEAGRVQPPGEVGELHLRGPGMFDAYLSPWRPREAVLNDGWLSTGDLARADADGDLFLVGRTHSVINVGGLKCFPEEVEHLLNEHEGVKAARVHGQNHPRFGAFPVAEIVAAHPEAPPSNAALTAWCRKHLAAYKCPLQFRTVSRLPRTPSGKIKREA